MTIKPLDYYTFPRLKIKQTSLGAEAKLIRKDEIKHRDAFRRTRNEKHDNIRSDLYWHRIGVVRVECRATNLVIAFLKGYPFERVERKTYIDQELAGYIGPLIRIATKYGNEKDQEKVKNALYNWIYAHPDLQSKKPNWLKA